MQLEICKMKREDFDTDEEYIEFRRLANLRNKKYYSKSEVKEKRKEYKKKYDKQPHVREANKKRRQTEHYKQRMKRWLEENKERLAAYRKAPERKIKKSISGKKYYLKRKKNKDLVEKDRKRGEKYRLEHPEKKKEHYRKYLHSEKGKMNYRYHNQRRLALLKERRFEITNEDLKKIYMRDVACVYCGSNVRLEIDHIVPLSKGGHTIYYNLVVSCKKCNCSKSGKDVIIWCKEKNIPVPSIIHKLLAFQNLKD